MRSTELIASIAGCDDPRVIMTAAANIAGLMLLANYDLTEEELRGLLVSRPSDPVPFGWLKDVTEVAAAARGTKNHHGTTGERP